MRLVVRSGATGTASQSPFRRQRCMSHRMAASVSSLAVVSCRKFSRVRSLKGRSRDSWSDLLGRVQ
eukprot:scaffold525_cov41-Attheya_sp.AAC.3